MSDAAPVMLAGMFDMDNYGDLLFPLLARHRLEPVGYRIVPVAPSSSRPSFVDAIAPVDIGEMMGGEYPIAGILIGGGYVIHASSLDFLDHYKGGDVGLWGGVGLWLGATLAAALRDVPVAWNAPGVPHPFSSRHHGLIRPALRAASYLSVRDGGSLRLLEPSAEAAIAIVPDPVAELPALWPRRDLASDFHTLLQRKGLADDTRLLAIHVRNRSLAGEDRMALAAALGELASARGLLPMLVAVGESHDDPTVARDLSRQFCGPHLVLDDPLSLREITAALAYSALYVGASLHGYVAATAYGVPGILVARPTYHKFVGYLEHVDRLQDLARDWRQAVAIAAGRRFDGRGEAIPASVVAALDRHWSAIVEALQVPHLRRPERREFALSLLRTGVRTEGVAWALQPLIRRQARRRTATLPLHTAAEEEESRGQ